jgi:hypothetical protein
MRLVALAAAALVALVAGGLAFPELGGEGQLATLDAETLSEGKVQLLQTGASRHLGEGVAVTAGAELASGPVPRGLGESATSLSTLFAGKRQHQPIKSRASNRCIVRRGNGVTMGSCRQSRWFFNRLTGAIVSNERRKRCLERRGSKLKLGKCRESRSQKFDKRCGAFVHMGKKKGKKSPDKVFQAAGRSVRLTSYTGKANQLWHYKEFVKHSKCRHKRYKVMKFRGSVKQTVMNRNMVGMPTEMVTVSMWLKGTRGTMFSYASKNHVNSFVLTNPSALIVYVMDKKIKTKVNVGTKTWTHLAVTWNSKTGKLVVFKNGKRVFAKSKVMRGKKISAGGCLMLGQRAKRACKSRIPRFAYRGELTDVMLWKGPKAQKQAHIDKIMHHPVRRAVLAKLGKLTAPTPNKDLRLAMLSRQYASQELGKAFPPKCKLVKAKKLSGPPGWMKWGGSGDVHYHSFAHCFYDDQSIGEWTALRVKKKYWSVYPLMVQFRTSPQRQRCSWCQNGAVAYIDGCAVQYKGEKASAGFGGFHFPNSQYKAYAAMNGKKLGTAWRRGRFMRAKAYLSNRKNYGWGHGNFQAILADGTTLACGKGSIRLKVPKKLKGKVEGIAGNGYKGREWGAGPNGKAWGLRAGVQTPGIAGCKPRYQYPYPRSPFNGNSPDKAIVKWFKSWQVDGRTIKSAFGYCCGRGPGSFNRVAGQKLKPIKGVSNNRPKGARALANKACRALRNNPKARAKCIFDYMVLGKKAIKKNMRDRMMKRKTNTKKPTHLSVRDLSKWRNDAVWVGHASWGCADSFSKHVTKGAGKKAMKAHRAAFKSKHCQCRAKYLGECAYDHFICIADRAMESVRYLTGM